MLGLSTTAEAHWNTSTNNYVQQQQYSKSEAFYFGYMYVQSFVFAGRIE